MKCVQCYELFGGIALKNHAFFSFYVKPKFFTDSSKGIRALGIVIEVCRLWRCLVLLEVTSMCQHDQYIKCIFKEN